MRLQTEPRMTRQRRVILEELRAAKSHPTADELFESVRQRLPRISLATVYRNLETLSECGMVKRLGPLGTQRRFDGDTSGHYHVRCRGCGSVADLQIEPLAGLEEAARPNTDYELLGHELEFVGICPACSAAVGARPETSER